MKKLIWILLGVVLLGGSVFLAWALTGSLPLIPLFHKDHAQAALVVNGKVIRADEFEQAYLEFLNRYRRSLAPEELINFERSLAGAPGAYYQLSLKSQLAEDLIRRSLLEQAAHEQGIKVLQSEVLQELRQEIWRFLEQNGVPPEQIEKALQDPKTYGSPFTLGLKEQIYWELLEERLRARIVGTIEPGESELRAYYESHKLRYYMPELVRVRHILISLPQDASAKEVEEGRLKLEKIREEWERGADFAELAHQYSEDEFTAQSGGDYGWIQRGDPTGKEFVDAAFSLKPGEVSPPVRTKRGWHLIQLMERRPARGETFENVAAEVRRDYIIQKTNERYQSWYERYRQAADVRIELPLLAAHLLEAQDWEAALKAYEQIRTQGLANDPYLGYYIARLYLLKLEEVQKELQQPEGDRDPNELAQLQAQVQDLKAKVIQNLKEVLAQAQPERGIFEEILKLAPDDPETLFGFARFLLDQGRWEEAARQLEEVLKAQPENLEALQAYGQLQMRMKNFVGAVKHLERALALSGQESTKEHLRLQLAQAYQELGRFEEAHSMLQQILESDPKHFQANKELGMLYMNRGSYSEAIAYLETALENSPPEQQAELQVLLGQASLGIEDEEGAESWFQKALQAPSPPVGAYRGLGELFKRRGDVEQALQHWRQGLKRAMNWSEREELAKLILKLSPQEVEAHFALADLYQSSRRYEESLQQYQAILEIKPDLKAWRGLGDVYLNLKQYAEAIAAFQKALSLAENPQDKAGLWARILNADRAQGSQHQQKAGLSSTGLEALYQLAKLSMEMGQEGQASEYLTQLLAADPSYRAAEVAQLVEQLSQKGVRVLPPPMP